MIHPTAVTITGKTFLSIILLLSCTLAFSQQRLEMKGTAIIGNKELPNVLYIVPWKSAEPITLSTPPFTSVLDKTFQPIERSTFKRQVKYYTKLYSTPEIKP